MSEFLQNNLVAIIIFLLLIIFLLMGSMIFILFRLLTRQPQSVSVPEVNAEPIVKQKARMAIKDVETISEKFYCTNHPDAPSAGSCLICEDVYCDNCLVEHEGMHFCKEHFRTYANHKWKQITDVRTTPDTPEAGLYIYNFKKEMWKKNIPSFVMTHYKIDIENDFIESFVQLNVREEDADELSAEIVKYENRLN